MRMIRFMMNYIFIIYLFDEFDVNIIVYKFGQT